MRAHRPSRTTEHWAYLAEAGKESELIALLGGEAAVIGEGVVMREGRPRTSTGEGVSPAFSRQAMATDGEAVPADPEAVARALAKALTKAQGRDPGPWNLQVVAPDTRAARDPRKTVAQALDEGITEPLDHALPRAIAESFVEQPNEADWLAQVWVVNDEQALVGCTRVGDALSRWPAGRIVVTEHQAAGSRAELQLTEAFDWLGLEPDKGDQAVDLGAGNGAFTEALYRRGLRVVMVDQQPKKLALSPKRLTTVTAAPHELAPEETVDWLVVHLPRRPIDTAKLIAKWGRRAWARQVLAIFPLLDQDRAGLLKEILEILADAGWKGLRSRQLYFGGQTVTVHGWLDPKLLARGPREPFRPRAKSRSEVTAIFENARAKAAQEARPRGRGPGPRPRGAARPRPGRSPRR